jgi:hypothetical protein
MSSTTPNTGPVADKKRSSRATWIVVLVLLTVLAAATIIFWQELLDRVHTARPQMLVAIAVAAWAGTVLIMYLWRLVSLMRARSRAQRSLDTLFEHMQRDVERTVDEATELAVVTTEWAVRAELVRDDVEDIQEYMQRLVKRPRVARAFVAGSDGTVLGAGDRKQKGMSIKRLVPNLPAESSTLQKLQLDGGATLFVAPVMGLESRLGTLIIELQRPALARTSREAIR